MNGSQVSATVTWTWKTRLSPVRIFTHCCRRRIMIMNEQKQTQSITISKRTLIIIIAIILAFIAGAVTLTVNWNDWFGDKPVITDPLKPDIDPDAGDWQGTEPPDNGGAASGIKIPGYPPITIAANTTDVTMALLNPEGNPCYFTFEIVLKDSGETIYTSKQVPPGKVISNVTLNHALSPGEYDAIIKITTNSTVDMHAMNGANVETVLVVK